MKNGLPIKIELPEKFLDEEVRYDFRISSDMKAVWAVELDLLNELSVVCKKLGINYFLDSGNLLGAARDGKFIPWDDDIDLVMLRADYDKLVLYGSEMFEYPYFLQHAFSDKEYSRPHAQLRNSLTCGAMANEGKTVPFNQGIFIDIFVLDFIDIGNEKKQIETITKMLEACKYIAFHHSSNVLVELIKKVRAKFYSLRYGDIKSIFKNLEAYVRSVDSKEYVDKVLFRTDHKQLHKLKTEWFMKSTAIEFEGVSCTVPSNYDAVLTAYYGKDYLVPKHENTMHSVNGGMIFDAFHSYKDVL